MEYMYLHSYVNHSIEFISLVLSEVHTNSIESLWKDVKYELKRSKTKKNFMYFVAKFYFMKSVKKVEKIKIIAEGLKKIKREVDLE